MIPSTSRSSRRRTRRVAALLGLAVPLLMGGCGPGPAESPVWSIEGNGLEVPWWEQVVVVKAPLTTGPAEVCIWVIPGDVLFASGSASIADGAAIDSMVPQLGESSSVEVVGHTDTTGDEAANLDLSARRAAAVADRLIAAGLSDERVRTRPMGEQSPRADETGPDPDAARALNRRVEVVGGCA